MNKGYLFDRIGGLLLAAGAMIYVATFHADTVRDVLRFIGIYSGA